MFRTGRSRTLGVITLMCALASSACTQGNIVSDFQRPTYMVVDRLSGGVEIRRYDARALAGSQAAEDAVTGSASQIGAAAADSGLVAVQVAGAESTEDAAPSGLLAALEASPRWQADGEPLQETGGSPWSFLGLERDQVAVPIRRRSLGDASEAQT